MCLVETPEQLVAFGHIGLRSSLGQNASGPPFIGLARTVAVCSTITRFLNWCFESSSLSGYIFLCYCFSTYTVILEAGKIDFVCRGYQPAGSTHNLMWCKSSCECWRKENAGEKLHKIFIDSSFVAQAKHFTSHKKKVLIFHKANKMRARHIIRHS